MCWLCQCVSIFNERDRSGQREGLARKGLDLSSIWVTESRIGDGRKAQEAQQRRAKAHLHLFNARKNLVL